MLESDSVGGELVVRGGDNTPLHQRPIIQRLLRLRHVTRCHGNDDATISSSVSSVAVVTTQQLPSRPTDSVHYNLHYIRLLSILSFLLHAVINTFSTNLVFALVS